MTPFILPPDRYHELPMKLDPANSVAIVVEDPDTKQVRSFMCAQNIVHIEPTHLDEKDRGGLTALRMFAHLLAALSAHGVTDYIACCDDPKVAEYLERLGLSLTPLITYQGRVPAIPTPKE